MCKFIYLLVELDEEDEDFFTFKKKSEKPSLSRSHKLLILSHYILQNRTFDNPSINKTEQCANSFTCFWNLMKKIKNSHLK